MSSVPLILAAASLRIAIPSFELENAPRLLAQRLPEYYAAAIDAAGCATTVGALSFSTDAADAVSACQGNAPCISGVGSLLGVDFVIVGHLTRTGDRFDTHLELIDVEKHAVVRQLDGHYSGALRDLGTSVRELVPQLCKAADPAWMDPGTRKAAPSLDDLSFDTEGLAAPKAPPPLPAPPLLEEPLAATPAPTLVAVAPPPAPPTPQLAEKSAPPPPEPVADAHPIPPAPVAPPTAQPLPPKLAVDLSPKPAKEPHVEGPPSLPRDRSGGFPVPVSSRARVLSYALFGTAGVAAVVGGGSGASVLSAVKDRLDATNLTAYNSAQSSALTRSSVANVAFGVAGAAALTSLIVWFAGDHLFHDNATTVTQASVP